MKRILHSSIILLIAANPVFSVDYTGGHADIGVALEDGTDFHLHLHAHELAVIDGSPLVTDEEYDAGDVTIVVPNSVATTVGSNIPAAGVNNGDTLWILPQVNPNTDTIPFLGIGTEELTPSNWSTNITFTLDSITSPSGSGTFSLWQSDGLGGLDFYFSSADAALTENGDNSLDVAPGGHDHYNYGFTEIGNWEVQLSVSGTHNTLGPLSDTQTFMFNVVPEPSTYGLLFSVAMICFTVIYRRRQS